MAGYSSEELSRMRLMDWYKDAPASQEAVIEGVIKRKKTGIVQRTIPVPVPFFHIRAHLSKGVGTVVCGV